MRNVLDEVYPTRYSIHAFSFKHLRRYSFHITVMVITYALQPYTIKFGMLGFRRTSPFKWRISNGVFQPMRFRDVRLSK
jgi:hypothetical protein